MTNKNIITSLFTLFFIPFLSLAQGNIEILVEDCRPESDHISYIKNLDVIKNGKIIYDFDEWGYTYGETIKHSLDKGKYTIVYSNMLWQNFSQTVRIKNNDTTKVHICVNEIDYDRESFPKSFIKQLKNEEQYNLYMSRSGCMGGKQFDITIRKENDVYTLYYKELKKILSAEDVQFIDRFENTLYIIPYSNACTSKTTYELSYKNKSFSVRDGGCNWEGIYYFIDHLKLEATEEKL